MKCHFCKCLHRLYCGVVRHKRGRETGFDTRHRLYCDFMTKRTLCTFKYISTDNTTKRPTSPVTIHYGVYAVNGHGAPGLARRPIIPLRALEACVKRLRIHVFSVKVVNEGPANLSFLTAVVAQYPVDLSEHILDDGEIFLVDHDACGEMMKPVLFITR